MGLESVNFELETRVLDHRKSRSAQKLFTHVAGTFCYPCSPGWTSKNGSGRKDLNLRPPGPDQVSHYPKSLSWRHWQVFGPLSDRTVGQFGSQEFILLLVPTSPVTALIRTQPTNCRSSNTFWQQEDFGGLTMPARS